MDPKDPVYRAELQKQIEQMRVASDVFYSLAQRAGVHPFIEFCGFMNEFIKLCEDALVHDVDFTMISTHVGMSKKIPFPEYRVNYLGEKFGCIFEPWFTAHPNAVIPFFRSAGIQIPDPSVEAEIE